MKRIELIQKAAMEYASYKTQDKGIAYLDFVRTAEWADRTMIEKACEWLKDNIFEYPWWDDDAPSFNENDIVNDFRKAMEE